MSATIATGVSQRLLGLGKEGDRQRRRNKNTKGETATHNGNDGNSKNDTNYNNHHNHHHDLTQHIGQSANFCFEKSFQPPFLVVLLDVGQIQDFLFRKIPNT
jgi:hypothetical protein